MITLYGVSDEITRRVVEKVLTRLPEKVSRFVMRWCLFISIRPGVAAMMLPIHVLEAGGEYPPGYLIVLDYARMQSQWAQDIVAHEIAHALLDHTYQEHLAIETAEQEADDQAVEWGFKSKADCK